MLVKATRSIDLDMAAVDDGRKVQKWVIYNRPYTSKYLEIKMLNLGMMQESEVSHAFKLR